MSNNEESAEFKSVFSAWKKRDLAGGGSDIARIGSGVSKVGSGIRSFTNAGTRKFGHSAKKLTSVVDDGAKKLGHGAKKLTAVVDDGAKKLTDTTKKVAGNTVKLTTDGAKKLTSVVTGKANKKESEEPEEMEEIVFSLKEDSEEMQPSSNTVSQDVQPNFVPVTNQSQADVHAKIAARYQSPKPERKKSVVDRYMPGRDQTRQASVPSLFAATETVSRPRQQPQPVSPDFANDGETKEKEESASSDEKKEELTSPQREAKAPALVLSPKMTVKLQKASAKRRDLSPVRKGAGQAVLSPIRAASISLQDRIKLFSNSNGSVPSWAANAKQKRALPKRVPLSEEQQKKQEEKSKWRDERRRQKKSVVPTRTRNVTAAPMKLTNFEPPKFPKSAIDVETISNSIRSNFLFEHLSKADLETLVQAFEKVRVHMGEEVIKQGEKGDYFYIIGNGQVRFLVNGKVVGSAGAGKSFGELALLYTSPRAATVIADSNPTYLFRVDQKSFRYIMQTKAQETEGQKMKLLQSIGFLKDFGKPDLERLSNCMVLQKFKANEYIVTKGEEGNAFYILKEGRVNITDIEAGGNKFDDVTLQPGGYFGERALITSEPRAANVIGKSEGSCFVIDRDTFEKVLGKFSKVILKSQDKVLLEGIHILKEAKLQAKVIDQLAFAIFDRQFAARETIMEEDKDTMAALYLVREGSVSVRDGNNTVRKIEAGGYFAEEHLLADALNKANTAGNMKSQLTVVCDEKCTCGVLTVKQCRLFVDTRNAFSIVSMSSKKKTTSDEGNGGNANNKSDESELRSSALMKRRSTIKETFNSNSVSMEDLARDELLGEGQFGQVWLVKADVWGTGEEEDMEQFALKIQKWDDGGGNKEFAAAIQREKEVISSLEHPFIVDLICSFDDEDESLMLMTIVEGGELWNVIHRENASGEWISGITESDARFYSLVVAEALAYMHHKNIVFRDLKPENVLIDKDGYPNIIDFGFAKVCEGNTFTFCGTPQYVAPEIILSQGHSFGVDHFALGILIYEMIAGENPFWYDGLGDSELYEVITKEEPYPLKDTVSKDVKDIVDALLTKDPTQRLGNLSGGESDILNHKWYANCGLDLAQLKEKQVKAPHIPELNSK